MTLLLLATSIMFLLEVLEVIELETGKIKCFLCSKLLYKKVFFILGDSGFY